METENNNRIAFFDTLVTRKLNIESSVLLQHQDDLHVVVNNYVKERVVTVRPSAPRYTVEVTAEKRKLRQLERKWRASRLPADRVRYVHQCNVVINLIKSLKLEYYSSFIKENSGNQKVLFKTVQKLLQKPTVNYYPPSKNDRMLADEFATFFTTKIDTLHNDLLVKKKALIYSADCVTDEVLTMSSTKFSIFTEMKLDDIRELTATMFSKSCVLDPLPSSDYQTMYRSIAATIANITTSLFLMAACLRV